MVSVDVKQRLKNNEVRLCRVQDYAEFRRCVKVEVDVLASRWFKCCFTSTETIDLLRSGAQDGHLDFHTGPEFSSRP